MGPFGRHGQHGSAGGTAQRTARKQGRTVFSLFHKLEESGGAWMDWQCCADLWPQKRCEELGRRLADGWWDTGSIDWRELKQALGLRQQGACQRARYRDPLISGLAKNRAGCSAFTTRAGIQGEQDSDENLLESGRSE